MGGGERSDRCAGIRVALAWLGVALIPAGLLLAAPSWWGQMLRGVSRVVVEYWPSVALIAVGVVLLVAYRLRRGARITGRLSLFQHVALLLGLALGFAVVLGGLLWWALGEPELTGRQAWTTSNTFDALKIVLLVVAGSGGVVALTVSYRKQRLSESAEHREATRLFTERYNRAAELLGSKDASVRVASLYAIAGLADEWAQGRQICINVLCASRRTPPPQDSGHGRPDWPAWDTMEQIITTHLRPGSDPHWQGYKFDLTGAYGTCDLAGIEDRKSVV